MNALQSLASAALSRGADETPIRFAGRWYGWAEVRGLAVKIEELITASDAHPRAPVLFLARNVPGMIAALLALIGAGRSIRMLYSFQSSSAIAKEVARLRPATI